MRRSLAALLVAGLVALLPLPLAAQSARPLTVVFKSATLPANARAIVERAGGTVVASIPEIGVMAITGPASLMNTLAKNKAVQAVSPTLEMRLPAVKAADANEPEAIDMNGRDLYDAYQWDIKQVTDDAASYDLGTGSHNTVVALVDTGVSTQHSALKNNLLGGQNFVPDGPGGTVVATDIEDKNGHGSHTAGNVAGNGRILGIGPDLGFRSYRVFGATGGTPSDRIFRAMIAAVADDVDVISMSIGGYDGIAPYTWTDPQTGIVYKGQDVADFVAYRRVVGYANQHGVVVVVSAGNEAVNVANPTEVTKYLNAEYGTAGYAFQGASREVAGTLPGVVNVSATGPDKSLSSYSNYGPGAIDVAAPGGDFQRYPVGDWYTDMCLSSYKNGGYVWMAGTSMAAPKAAAVAALIIDKAKAAGETLMPSQVVAALQQTSIDLGKPGADPLYGHGFVSAYMALQ